MPLNCVESDFREKLSKNMKGRVVTPGRVAHLTATSRIAPVVHVNTGIVASEVVLLVPISVAIPQRFLLPMRQVI